MSLSESRCALSRAPLRSQSGNLCCLLPALVGGVSDCRLEQQVEEGGDALPSSSFYKALLTPGNAKDKECLSKETALLGYVRSAVLRENRHKWGKVLT